MMKTALALMGVAVVGAFFLPPDNSVAGCAEALRHRTQPGIVHECDGLTIQQQNEALREAGLPPL